MVRHSYWVLLGCDSITRVLLGCVTVSLGVSQSFTGSQHLHLQGHAVKHLFLDFIPEEQTPCTYWIGAWVGPRASLEILQTRWPLPGNEARFLSHPTRSLHQLCYPSSQPLARISFILWPAHQTVVCSIEVFQTLYIFVLSPHACYMSCRTC